MILEHQIAQQLARYPQVKLGILFGSVVRRQARFDSDLDLAVAADRPLGMGEKVALIEDLALLASRPVDLVDLQTAGGLVLQEILTKGIPIYKTDSHLYAELIKKMLFNEADFMPYRNRIIATRRKAWIGA
jgi:predicted nucleotidyltransferase